MSRFVHDGPREPRARRTLPPWGWEWGWARRNWPNGRPHDWLRPWPPPPRPRGRGADSGGSARAAPGGLRCLPRQLDYLPGHALSHTSTRRASRGLAPLHASGLHGGGGKGRSRQGPADSTWTWGTCGRQRGSHTGPCLQLLGRRTRYLLEAGSILLADRLRETRWEVCSRFGLYRTCVCVWGGGLSEAGGRGEGRRA